ncbi:MAG: NUDIX hydrolase [Prevotella sp.]
MTKERDMKWKTLKSEYLIRRTWLTARKDCVMLPNGVVNDEYYVLEYPTWINVIAITQEGKFIFVRQYRHGLGETCYEIVAGVSEKDEEPLESAQRELLEETGYCGGEWKELTVISANSSTMNNLTHCFLATGVEKVADQHLDETEDIEVFLFTEDEVKRLLLDDCIKQSLMAAPLWKYFYMKEIGKCANT